MTENMTGSAYLISSVLFILSLSTSLWSIASAGYPLVHHIFQKGSLKDGLEEPYKKDKNLVINKLFELRRNTSILPVTSAERKDEIIKRQKAMMCDVHL